MLRPRKIPVLLLKGKGLVKSIKFGSYKYIGDPINAARIFNEMGVDELILLDIDASIENRLISTDVVRDVAEELTAPFSVGGGIRSLTDIERLIDCGVEKVVIGTTACEPAFIEQASNKFGSSTISVCMDVATDSQAAAGVMTKGGRNATKYGPVEFAIMIESSGAGELIVQSIDRDGTFEGFDTALVESVSTAVGIPVIALGGAASDEDLSNAITSGKASAAAAGSMFVFADKGRGVLINYSVRPEQHL